MPLFFLIFSKWLTFSVFTKVTIGIGDDIHREKASARLLSWGKISVFMVPLPFIYQYQTVCLFAYLTILYHVLPPKISPAKPCTASAFQRFHFFRCAPYLGFEQTIYHTIYAKIPYLVRLRTHLYSVAEQHIVKGQPKIAKQNQLFPVEIDCPIFSIKKTRLPAHP